MIRCAARTLFAVLFLASPALAQVAQIKISMSPGDGIRIHGGWRNELFFGSATFLWPQGSKHICDGPTACRDKGTRRKSQYGFSGMDNQHSGPAELESYNSNSDC